MDNQNQQTQTNQQTANTPEVAVSVSQAESVSQPPTLQPQSQPPSPNDDLKYIIPINRSGYAIAAGYLGLTSILIITAPFALLLGILGLRDIKKHPGRLGKGRAWFGIISGAFFLAIPFLLFIISVLNAL